jgi:hypothetical protein
MRRFVIFSCLGWNCERNERPAVHSSLNSLWHRLRTTVKPLTYHTFRIETHNVATVATGIVQSLRWLACGLNDWRISVRFLQQASDFSPFQSVHICAQIYPEPLVVLMYQLFCIVFRFPSVFCELYSWANRLSRGPLLCWWKYRFSLSTTMILYIIDKTWHKLLNKINKYIYTF